MKLQTFFLGSEELKGESVKNFALPTNWVKWLKMEAKVLSADKALVNGIIIVFQKRKIINKKFWFIPEHLYVQNNYLTLESIGNVGYY